MAPTSATQRTKSEDMRIKHAVLEFLRYHGMKNTMECFEVESQQKLKQTNAVLSPRSGGNGTDGIRFRVKRDMLACFEDGLSSRFFANWDKNVPMDLRDKDKTCQKLEFYVQLHFATLPFRPTFLRKMAQKNSQTSQGGARSAAGAAASAMLGFRKYLESRGKILSNSPEFLQYYALPYVPNPTEHPSFKGVFKPQWPLDIRVRLERFLDVVLQSVTLPELYTIFDTSNQINGGGSGSGGGGGGGGSGGSSNLTTTLGVPNNASTDSSEIRKMRSQLQATFMSREEKLKDFARNIYSVSVEMLRELERAGKGSGEGGSGGQVRPEFVTFAKSRLDMFSEVLSQKVGMVGSNNASNGGLSNNIHSSAGSKEAGGKENGGDGSSSSSSSIMFDYAAVRDDLAKLADLIVEHNADEDTMSSRKCARLLQALRWKLSRTRPRSTRKKLLKLYIQVRLWR